MNRSFSKSTARPEPESVVIVRGDHGYVAYVRYADELLNQDIASKSKYILYDKIEQLANNSQGSW